MPCLGECGKICDRWTPDPECRALCSINNDGKTFVTVRVAGVIPYDAPNGAQPFDLCQGGKCVEAGELCWYLIILVLFDVDKFVLVLMKES